MSPIVEAKPIHIVSGRRVNKHSPVPLYHQLEAILLERINQGGFRTSDKLPAERELAAEFGVSKITVRQALSNLAAAGVVRRDQGRGTFVAEPKVEEGPRELTSFSQEMVRRGLRPSSLILQKEVIPAEAGIAAKLGLRQGDRVFRWCWSCPRARFDFISTRKQMNAAARRHSIPGTDALFLAGIRRTPGQRNILMVAIEGAGPRHDLYHDA